MNHPVEPPTRTVHFTAPPPAEMARRCLDDAEALTALRLRLLDAETEGRPLYMLDGLAEQLRGVIADLAVAAGYLHGAVSQ